MATNLSAITDDKLQFHYKVFHGPASFLITYVVLLPDRLVDCLEQAPALQQHRALIGQDSDTAAPTHRNQFWTTVLFGTSKPSTYSQTPSPCSSGGELDLDEKDIELHLGSLTDYSSDLVINDSPMKKDIPAILGPAPILGGASDGLH